MGKPRVVIADAEEAYLAALQQKFIETFFDRIDLEIITEKPYFDFLFSAPQKMDILVVSEEFYSTALQRHNIGKVFLMTEQPDRENTLDLTVTSIFKYTNIKEVFNEIIGSSAETLQIQTQIPKETQVILIYSAGGGAGKTTVALGVAACLAKAHKRILYLDAEYIQNFQYFLKQKNTIANDLIPAFQVGNEALTEQLKKVIQKELFDYLPPFQTAISSYSLNFGIYAFLIEQMKKKNEYDFILVDTDAAFSDEKANLMDHADKVYILLRQDAYSVYQTDCMLKNINFSDGDKFLFFCNAFQEEYENALLNPNSPLTFMVNEYIRWIPECEKRSPEELAEIDGLQKIAYSLL